MSTPTTPRAETEATSGRTEPDRSPWSSRIRSTVERYGGEGTAAALAGGILLAGAIRTAGRSKRRAGILALVGGTLLFAGLRRRRSADRSRGRGEGEVSADAEVLRDRSDVMGQSEENPRGVSGEPDVETRTDSDEGDVRFTSEQDEATGPKPGLEGTTADDPRRPDEAAPETRDDHVEVDLSEAAMADEASEATGPDPEQAYPSMEGTDPEPTSPAAPDRDADESKESEDAESEQGERAVGEGADDDEGREVGEGADDDEAREAHDHTQGTDDDSGVHDEGGT